MTVFKLVSSSFIRVVNHCNVIAIHSCQSETLVMDHITRPYFAAHSSFIWMCGCSLTYNWASFKDFLYLMCALSVPFCSVLCLQEISFSLWPPQNNSRSFTLLGSVPRVEAYVGSLPVFHLI